MSNVREFMTSDPVTVSSDCSLMEAARIMRAHDVGVLPVINEGEFCGVITDRDIVIKAVAAGRFDDTVGSFISMGVVTVAPDDDVERAAELMSENDVRRLPVCDGGNLVGMLSVGDIATRASKEYAGTVMEQTGPEA